MSTIKALDRRIGDLFDGIRGRGGWRYVDTAVSEGFCPACERRGGFTPIVVRDPADEEVEERPLAAVVHCLPCDVTWEAGLHPVEDRGAIRAQVLHNNMTMTYTLWEPEPLA